MLLLLLITKNGPLTRMMMVMTMMTIMTCHVL